MVLAAFLATRVLAIAATHAGARFMSPQKQAEWAWIPGRSDLHVLPPPPALLAPLIRWDAPFYLALAKEGYPAPRGEPPVYHLGFFPLYPLAVRTFEHVLGNFFWAAFAKPKMIPGKTQSLGEMAVLAVRDNIVRPVLGAKGVPGVKAAYAASKAGVRSLGESLRAEYANGPIKVSVLEPGYIESEMTGKSQSTMFMVDNETGVKALVAAIEREPGRAAVPWWPWAPMVQLLRVLPPPLAKRFA